MWGAAEKCKLKSKKCKVRSEKCTHLPSSTFRTSSVILSLGKCWRFWEVKMFSLRTEHAPPPTHPPTPQPGNVIRKNRTNIMALEKMGYLLNIQIGWRQSDEF